MMCRAWPQGHTAREKLKFSAFGFVLWYLGRVSGIGISEALGVRSRSWLHSVAVDVSGQHCPRRVPAAGTAVADGRTAVPTSTMQLTPLHPSSLLMFVHLASPLFLKRQEICALHSDKQTPSPDRSLEPPHAGRVRVLGARGLKIPRLLPLLFGRKEWEDSPLNTRGLSYSDTVRSDRGPEVLPCT